jgi:hypothetical protein
MRSDDMAAAVCQPAPQPSTRQSSGVALGPIINPLGFSGSPSGISQVTRASPPTFEMRCIMEHRTTGGVDVVMQAFFYSQTYIL